MVNIALYCTALQRDPLLDSLTALEQLVMYGLIRGLHPRHVLARARLVAQRCSLAGAHLTAKPTAALSGGTRRKASLAIALVGSPRVILLDEPSAGGHLWKHSAHSFLHFT